MTNSTYNYDIYYIYSVYVITVDRTSHPIIKQGSYNIVYIEKEGGGESKCHIYI